MLLWNNLSFGFKFTDFKKTSYIEIEQAGIWIKQNSNPGDLIITESKPQNIYYSDRDSINFEEVNKTGGTFEEGIQKLKPKYLILSLIERSSDWAYLYPQNNSQLIPVYAYPENSQQPVLIIYQFKYN